MPNIGTDGMTELEWVAETAQHPESNNFQRYCDWWDWHQDQLSQERELKKVKSIKSKLGWSKCRLFRRVASMPLHVFNILRRIDPEFATNTPDGKKALYKFLLRRPEFSTSWNRYE